MSEQEYDDTNRGAWFRPKSDDARHSLEGKINVEGREIYTTLFKATTKNDVDYWRICVDDCFTFNGDKQQKVYRQIGVIFKSKSDHEKAPAVTGYIHLGLTEKRVSAWRGESSQGTVYYSVKVEDPYRPEGGDVGSSNTGGSSSNRDIDDDIPF